MKRDEMVLRELNLHPVWVRRTPPVAAAVPAMQAEHSGKEQAPQAEPSGSVVASDWPALRAAVRDCHACALRAGCIQTVFGVGDEAAEWLFVGEGPGAEEDKRGEPFVGEAGKLLDNMLLAIGLQRGKGVYIANVVKCRPPENRRPYPEEVAACLPYLERQIALLRPRLIVALGKTAASALLGQEAGLATLRGVRHQWRDIPLLVTYHPAYLLRQPEQKASAWRDLCLARDTMRQLKGDV